MGRKTFCIGLSRTGTSSLHAAAVILGVPAVHYPAGLAPQWMAGDFTADRLNQIDFYSDIPVPAYYRQFDRMFPEARFVLTLRDPQQWADSVERYFGAAPAISPEVAPRDLIRLAVYGMSRFHRQHFLDVYKRHTDDVLGYFRSRPDDLLTLDITKEPEPWTLIGGLLGKTPPPGRFPHLTSAQLGKLSRVLPAELEEKRRALLALVEAKR